MVYSVTLTHSHLPFNMISSWLDFQLLVFDELWKTFSPPKLIAFFWQLVLDRIIFRMNFLLKVYNYEPCWATCGLYGYIGESTLHLFFHVISSFQCAMRLQDGWSSVLLPDLSNYSSLFTPPTVVLVVNKG